MDIVVPIAGQPTGRTFWTNQGFHADTAEAFAEAFAQALSLAPDVQFEMRTRARQHAAHFSEIEFITRWNREIDGLLSVNSVRRRLLRPFGE